MQIVKNALRRLFLFLVALILLFEEWGWDSLQKLFALLARLPLWAWLERRIAALPPWAALLTFAVPALALLPVKLLALYLFGSGHATLGLVLLLGAKLAGTAVLARLFSLTQPALMKLGWFARWYPRWKHWKDAILEQVRQSRAWRMGRHVKREIRAVWRGLLRRMRG